ncbi:hypothetical protein HNY73_018386 [Argiope bruennichi]|uniref:Uncharacterized protein n=1 Tax=Argiope bruennichi TaxID=94029 RepID=A0A8T0EDQ1_ARGBR|nr:hypothetical protein HNY73_018386 [Argiope bruennichi]
MIEKRDKEGQRELSLVAHQCWEVGERLGGGWHQRESMAAGYKGAKRVCVSVIVGSGGPCERLSRRIEQKCSECGVIWGERGGKEGAKEKRRRRKAVGDRRQGNRDEKTRIGQREAELRGDCNVVSRVEICYFLLSL